MDVMIFCVEVVIYICHFILLWLVFTRRVVEEVVKTTRNKVFEFLKRKSDDGIVFPVQLVTSVSGGKPSLRYFGSIKIQASRY